MLSSSLKLSNSTLPVPRKAFVSLRAVILAVYLQVSIFYVYRSKSRSDWSWPKEQVIHEQHLLVVDSPLLPPIIHSTNTIALTPNITLVGISYSDKTVSEAAVRFLLEAACKHNIRSYLLLSERYSGDRNPDSLDKKIHLLSEHKYLPLAKGGMPRPECTNLIHIESPPNQKQLIQQTMTRLKNDGLNISSLSERRIVPDNPLSEDRIGNIKRAREYQRQRMRHLFRDDHELHQSAIAVLDLDMFDYPSVPQVIDVSERYILPSHETEENATKFHAICANGLQRGRLRRGETNLRRGYYDSFATVLLPDTWLHLRREAGMSAEDMLDWFLDEGGDGYVFHPVPVRSCFGGFALYRADLWLDDSCRYDRFGKKSSRYIGGKERHTCEHVLFHECLTEKFSQDEGTNSFSIAVQPDLLTLWHLI